MFQSKPAIERFKALTRIVPGACWEWLGSKSKDGYGQFVLEAKRGHRRVRISPYRFIWEYFNGPMPGDREPDHTCNNRSCVNPAHIEPVTHSENQKRSYRRGRKRGCRPRPSHCRHGHEYTPANTLRVNPLQCRECNRIRCSTYNAKRSAHV
jgi:hypothetical protein